MNFDFSPEEAAFAREVRAFVKENLDPAVRAKVWLGQLPSPNERKTWQRALVAKGWGAPSWPVEFGGTGWNAVQKHLYEEALAEEGAPPAAVFGMGMLAPVLMRFGTQAQKDFYLPRILTGEDFWCQGFSEPGAGSDLASLRSRAELIGGQWVINGQKTWTTLAHQANRMFCLARTSPGAKKQEGISLLLVDMDTPGITVRPIITIEGGHEVNEVFLDNVRVPAENIVGEPGKGWDYAKYLLGHERTGIAGAGHSKRELNRLKTIARESGAIDEPEFRSKIAKLEIELMALEITNLRMVSAMKAGAAPGAEANMLKILGTELKQNISEAMMDAAGARAFRGPPMNDRPGANDMDPLAALAGAYFNLRKVTIYGGSNEIQRNILAKSLGL